LRRFVAMAVVAGIGRGELCRQVGPRDAEAVIVAPVDHHIGALRHVAGRAGERGARAFMAVMGGSRVFLRRVTLHADAVTGGARLRCVRLVAIAAGDAGSEHPALLERAVIVDLIAHLPVGLIEPAREQRDDVGVGERAAGHPILGKRAAARVTPAAGFDLLAHRGGREVAVGVAARSVDPPDTEANGKTLLRVIVLAEGPPALLGARPGDVVERERLQPAIRKLDEILL